MDTRKSAGIAFAQAAASATPYRVLDRAVRDFVLHGIDQFDVPDGSLQLPHLSRNSFVTLATHSYLPLHRRSLPHRIGPVFADFGEIGREGDRAAAAIGAVNHDDGLVGKVDAGIDL